MSLTKSETHMGMIESYCKQNQVKLCPQVILRVAYQLRGGCVSIQRLAMWVNDAFFYVMELDYNI